MNSIDFNGIDSPHAMHGAVRLAQAIERGHASTMDHIATLGHDAIARSAMRAVYSVRMEALTKALNDLAHCQRELEARALALMEQRHGSEAECAVEYLLMPNNRFPATDEQP